MSKTWNLQAQIVTPDDIDVMEVEEELGKLGSLRSWESNYSNAVLADLGENEEID